MTQEEVKTLLAKDLEATRQALISMDSEILKGMWVDLLRDPEIKALLLEMNKLDEDKRFYQKLLEIFVNKSETK